MAHWLPLNEISKDTAGIFSDNEYNNILAYSSYSEFLLNEAKCQLAQMKSDILKAIVQNRPFLWHVDCFAGSCFSRWLRELDFSTAIYRRNAQSFERCC